ncbi:hypothetical protein KKG46_03240 [Patescibacteria group bacterium]|nr:hypothetical protein [Patescibacteria group bacterium]
MPNLKIKITLIVAAIVASIAILGLIFWAILINRPIQNDNLTNYSGYQAVFLTNGQVYFGNITKNTSDEIILENIFYLKMDDSAATTSLNKDQSDLQLIKLGKELHGPKDMMYINPDHVVFIEDLTDSSKVVNAIQSYKQ